MTKKNYTPKSYSVKFTDSFASSFTVQMAAPIWALKGSDAVSSSYNSNSQESETQKINKQ